MKQAILQALAIIIVAAAVGGLSNTIRSDDVPWISTKMSMQELKPVPADSLRDSTSAPFPILIHLEEVEKHRGKDAVIIDARLPESYAAGHIKGAVNIPFENLDPYQKVLSEIPKDTMLIVYCDGQDCDLSYDLSLYMIQHGYKRIFEYEDGWAEWSASGLPITKGGTP